MSHNMLRVARNQAAVASGQRLFSAVPAVATENSPVRSGTHGYMTAFDTRAKPLKVDLCPHLRTLGISAALILGRH